MRRGVAIALVLMGCGPARSTPEGAYLSFSRSFGKYEFKACWALLSTPTRDQLTKAAGVAAKAVGKPAPPDGLSLAFGSSKLLARKVSKIEIESSTDAEATLLVTDDHGNQERVHMVAEGPAWRLDLTNAFSTDGAGPGAN